MKALTICQPYASMIARGEKTIENRTWPTRYRGRLLIHAGKSREWMDDYEGYDPKMVFGAAVAVATLVDCVLVRDLTPMQRNNPHANGPICWILADVKRLKEPVPMRGAQGLWDAEFVEAEGA